LLPASPAPVLEVAEPGPPVQVTSPEEAADLLDDFLLALLDFPGWSDPESWLWNDVAAALPDELYERIDQYIERALQESKKAGGNFRWPCPIFASSRPGPDFPVQVLTWWL